MPTLVQPYLMFGGRCDEALAFYRTAIGARVEFMMRFKDSPEPPPAGTLAPGFEDKVMHVTFHVGETTLMASDGCDANARFDGFLLSLTVPTEAEAARAFEALQADGEVRMPLTKTFWSPCFGMLTDKFGVGWMVTVPGEQHT